jgi:hypothetical protein
MIRYALRCAEGHAFESWFRDSDAYETQRAGGVVGCPVCGSIEVEKQIMAPAVSVKDEAARGAAKSEAPKSETGDGAPVVVLGEREAALRAMMRQLRREIVANSDDVGERFPEEARRIHYGETDPRSIRGQATPEEAKALHEEGVEFMPMPPLPDDRN